MPAHALDYEPSSCWSEKLLIGLLILIVLGLNLVTGDRCPAVWVDEAAYFDPAWNLQLGNGFTSSAWYAQDETAFWAGNVPLYPAMLWAWTKAFGTSILSVRAMNYVLISIAIVLIWLAVKRLRLVGEPRQRILLVSLVLLGFGVSFSYRSGRPDTACLLLAAAAMAAWSIERRGRRWAALAGLGLLFPAAGLQLVVWTGLLGVLLLPFVRFRYLAEACALVTGIAIGGLLLFAFYTYHGVWEDFLASTVGTHSTVGGRSFLQSLAQMRMPGGIKDPSYLFVFLATSSIAAVMLVRKRLAWQTPLGFALLTGIGVPMALWGLRGQYPCYYSWMAYIPMSVGLCSTLSNSRFELPATMRRAVVPGMLGAACLIGFPLVVGMTFAEWEDRDYRRIEELVDGKVASDDYVYCGGAAYYALKPRAFVETGRHHLHGMNDTQKERLTMLVIDPGTFPIVQPVVGGEWAACGEPLRPSRPQFLGIYSEYFFNKYRLQVYRRVKPAGETQVAELQLTPHPPPRSASSTPRESP